MNFNRSAAAPMDQADGLRRLFAHSRRHVIPVVSNPHMAFGGVMLERVCSAFAEQGGHVLVVDASEKAPQPQEVALMDLRDAIEALSTQVSYLAARGLPLHFVNTHGSTAGFVNRVMEAAPQAEVVLIHASAADLCRLLGRSCGNPSVEAWAQEARPLLLVDDRPSSVTHAYASLKLLAQRGQLMVHDFLLGAAEHSPRAPRIAEQLKSCAEHFLGALVREVLQVDPAADARDPPPDLLRRWVQGRLCSPVRFGAAVAAALPSDAELLVRTPPAFYAPPSRRAQHTDLNSWS
jgi:hypothetical protein